MHYFMNQEQLKKVLDEVSEANSEGGVNGIANTIWDIREHLEEINWTARSKYPGRSDEDKKKNKMNEYYRVKSKLIFFIELLYAINGRSAGDLSILWPWEVSWGKINDEQPKSWNI